MTARLSFVVGAVVAAVVAALLAVVAPAFSPRAAAADELQPFTDCEDLRRWYVDRAVPQVTAWGLGYGHGGGDVVFFSVPAMADERVGAASEGSAALGGAVDNGPTGTNVQEVGVDEPDLAKTDGQVVVMLDRRLLRVVDVSGGEPRPMGTLRLPRRVRVDELLLVDDRAVLLGAERTGPWPLGLRMAPPWPPVSSRTTLLTVDLADPSRPRLVHTERIEGDVVSAREHDGIVRVAVSSTPRLPFVHPTRRRSAREAAAVNRRIVRGATIADWLPSHLLECSDVRHPREPSGLGTITVLTFDPHAPAAVDATGVTADGRLVYASDDRLYVATVNGGWSWWTPAQRTRPQAPVTRVHAFAIDGRQTSYVASGSVPGVVKDRWAFSEYDGLLRVATMRGNSWRPRDNAVTVLREGDGALRRIGSVGGMGAGEQTKAVRWFGDIAVLVTFRQTDPLYTVDLSDPRHPRVRGALKITGYSGYLHPVGDDLLLGIGQAATARGRQTGAQVRTFDLSDLDQPRPVDRLSLGRHTYSPVEHESRAFTYLVDRRLALVPVGSWRGGAEVALVQVGPEGDLRRSRAVPVSGALDRTRSLPLGDGRVALVAGAEVAALLDFDAAGSTAR